MPDGDVDRAARRAAVVDRILLDVLNGWDDRWGHTTLVSALAHGRTIAQHLGPDTLDLLADEVLEGFLVPRDAATAARQLLAEGRFDVVEEMIDGGRLPPEDSRQLRSELAEARHAAAERAARALHLLSGRAAQLDLHRSWPETDGLTTDGLVGLAVTDESAFTDLLAGWEQQAQEAEDARADELRGELAGQGAGDPSGAAEFRLLEDCLAAREFRLAGTLVHRDRSAIPSDAGPSGLPRQPRLARLHRYTLEHVMDWYRRDEQGDGELHGWLPVPTDAAGRRLVETLATLVLKETGERFDPDPVRQLVEALHACVGTGEPVLTFRTAPGGILTRLYCTADHRLPPLDLFGRTGIPMWVAPSLAEPPEEVASGPYVRLVPEWEGDTPLGDRCGVLYADDLLRLAAPTPLGTVPLPAERELRLLRAVGPGLGIDGLLDCSTPGAAKGIELGGPGKAALQLSWFFDLLGLQPDSVTVEAVLYETGAHPLALRVLLGTLCGRRGPRPSGRELRDRLEAVREDDDWRRAAALRIKEQIPDIDAGLVLATALWLHSGGSRTEFDVSELRAVLAELAAPGGVPRSVKLEMGLEPLLSQGIMERRNGRLVLAPNGLPEILAQGSGQQPDEWLTDLLRQARDAEEAVIAQVVISLSDLAADLIEHYNTNLQRKVTALSALMVDEADRGRRTALNDELKRALAQLQEQGSLFARTQQAPEALRLADVIGDQALIAHLDSRGRDGYDVECDEKLRVRANPWLLGQVFWNLFDNSRKAIGAVNARIGYVDVSVTAFTEATSEPWCSILVADSGDGIAEGMASRLNQGERLSTRGGSGKGLHLARALVERYGGRLRVLTEPSTKLLGAQIRIELPLLPAPET
ncbi:HAMP domain-containing sensor histidine kinase [Streptomyces sp. NPDC005722]